MKKITKYDPEYWGLSAMCTDEMAEVALKMGVRKPKTLDEMVKLTGMERTHLEELLQQMAVNGVIEYNWRIQNTRNSMCFQCLYREVLSLEI